MRLFRLLSELALVATVTLSTACSGVSRTVVEYERLKDSDVSSEIISLPMSFIFDNDSSEASRFLTLMKEGMTEYLDIVPDSLARARFVIDSVAVDSVTVDVFLSFDEYTDKYIWNIEATRPIYVRMILETPDTTACYDFADELFWTVGVADTTVGPQARALAMRYYPTAARHYGTDVADMFFPSWETDTRTIFTRPNRRWAAAGQLAGELLWEDARAVWMDYTDTGNRAVNAAAAYNIAVSYEMTKQYAIALQWLDFIDKFYPEYKSVTLRRECESRLGIKTELWQRQE